MSLDTSHPTPHTEQPCSCVVFVRDGSMLNTSAANVIKTHLLTDPIGYLRSSYTALVVSSKAVTKAAAHVLQ